MPKVMASAPNAGGRHQRGRRIAPTLSEINVVPLVDVMLVLLIIFMVAAPMLQRGVEVNLPVASRSQEIASNRLFVDLPATYREDRRVFIDKEGVRLDFLAERVRQMMLTRSDKLVYLRGDGAVNLQELMEVFDRLKEAGVQNVGIISKLPGEQ
ncbi:MAG TPA: biopolymer transporter ExbD [Vicinamibacterales bacterium]|jgi:biopolymer transport protein ExbD|nr:biopolymer transporter ExbD [Vicinamibacterales bacterium]